MSSKGNVGLKDFSIDGSFVDHTGRTGGPKNAALPLASQICSSVWSARLAIFNQTGADGEFPQFTADRRLAGECR